eukprot:9961644-Lingulodinium_polyedra.AAC.1
MQTADAQEPCPWPRAIHGHAHTQWYSVQTATRAYGTVYTQQRIVHNGAFTCDARAQIAVA